MQELIMSKIFVVFPGHLIGGTGYGKKRKHIYIYVANQNGQNVLVKWALSGFVLSFFF